jgi:hypothetical protein
MEWWINPASGSLRQRDRFKASITISALELLEKDQPTTLRE